MDAPGSESEQLAMLAPVEDPVWTELWSAVDELSGPEPWVRWEPSVERDGVLHLGYPEYSDALLATLRGVAGAGVIEAGIGPAGWWGQWIERAGDLRSAPMGDVIRYLSHLIRNERMSEGSVDGAMERGDLPVALARLRDWHASQRADEPGRG